MRTYIDDVVVVKAPPRALMAHELTRAARPIINLRSDPPLAAGYARFFGWVPRPNSKINHAQENMEPPRPGNVLDF